MNKWNLLCGSLLVRVKGAQALRFLHICTNSGMRLTGICWEEENSYCFVIPAKDYWHIRRIRKKTHVQLTILEKNGWLIWKKDFFRHKFVFFLASIGVIIVICMSQMVWKYNISGNQRIRQEDIMDWLEEYGCPKQTWIRDIDCDSLEISLWKAFPDIAWLTVYVDSNTLYVEIEEKIPYN